MTLLATVDSSSFDWTLANTRNLLHLIGVISWVGGLILMGALMPIVARTSPEAIPKITKRFSRVAWPAFYLAIITGLWTMGSKWEDAANSWRIALFIKLGLVAITGIAAWLHLRATNRQHKMIFAAVTLMVSIAVVVIGIGLGN